MERWNHLDLFSGIGGFAYAAQLAGINFHRSYYSDIEPFANRVYAKNFPNAIPLGDIHSFDGKTLRTNQKQRWFLTGGFPCQDISTAGKQRGLAGARSGLWWEMHRVIDGLRPEAILIENVPALRSKGLERVLFSLAVLGYNAEWETISAASLGAPHIRKRIWIVAYPADTNCNGIKGRGIIQTKQRDVGKKSKGNDTVNVDAIQSCGAPIATNASVHLRKHNLDAQYPQGRDVGNVKQSHPKNQEHNPWADWGTIATEKTICGKPILLGVDDGLPDELDETLSRIKACGNAIVPQVAAQILRSMKDCGLLA